MFKYVIQTVRKNNENSTNHYCFFLSFTCFMYVKAFFWFTQKMVNLIDSLNYFTTDIRLPKPSL